MNKENAHLFLPLVQALAQGKTIQLFSNVTHEWRDREHSVCFDLKPERYRIKPEPIKQEFYYPIHKNVNPNNRILYTYDDLEKVKAELNRIDPKGENYVIMRAKADEIV